MTMPGNPFTGHRPGYRHSFRLYPCIYRNQSIGNDVWFDNVHLEHYTGQVLEEDMYYPFGLTISQDAATGATPNNYKLSTKELQTEFGLNYYDFGARMQDEQIGRWFQLDPLAATYESWSPYSYAMDNPIHFIDIGGMGSTEFFNTKGKKIGEDENGIDGNVQIVTNKDEVKLVKHNNKSNSITNSKEVKSGVKTTKTVLKESINVLDRTITNGGNKEESSIVTADGIVLRGKTGSKKLESRGNELVATSTLPENSDVNSTSIHSHLTSITPASNGNYNASTATKVGPDDPANFTNFHLNIIVGNLGLPTIEKSQSGTKITMPKQGAVFYNSNSEKQLEITEHAIKIY